MQRQGVVPDVITCHSLTTPCRLEWPELRPDLQARQRDHIMGREVRDKVTRLTVRSRHIVPGMASQILVPRLGPRASTALVPPCTENRLRQAPESMLHAASHLRPPSYPRPPSAALRRRPSSMLHQPTRAGIRNLLALVEVAPIAEPAPRSGVPSPQNGGHPATSSTHGVA